MTDRPFRLPSLGSIIVTGTDAQPFLQGQLSSDLRELTHARGQLSAWHDPKGRVLVFLRMLPWQDGYLLVTHATLRDTVVAKMRMYVLRAKVQLQAGPPVHGLAPAHAPQWLAAAGLESADATLSAAEAHGLAALRVPGAAGWLVVGELGGQRFAEDEAAASAWERAEIEAGLPEITPATSGQFIAQMLNLDRLGAISFTKGCFPGQEVIARAQHLGRVKRRARLFSAEGGPPQPGEALQEAGGAVLRAVATPAGCLLLAVVPVDEPGPLHLGDGRPLTPIDYAAIGGALDEAR
jgi:tRNA-modifying protein YgfZ